MDSRSIELPESQVEQVSLRQDGSLVIRFDRAYLIQTMTGSVERTLWWQAGDLVLENAELEDELPDGPLSCLGGDVRENIYTYRDMIPLPLLSRGAVGVSLRFKGSEQALVARGDAIRMEMVGDPKYIRHIRPGDS